MEDKKPVGRPRLENPKMRHDLRLKMSTIIDIEIIAEELGITKSEYLQQIIESEIKKQKILLGID